MAEFCVDCFNKICGKNLPQKNFILSGTLYICEECGELKRVVLCEKVKYAVAKRLYRRFGNFLRRKFYK